MALEWLWFHKATAVFLEGLVLGGNLDTLRFALNWSDAPERSLDDEGFQYQSGFFARYLARRFGTDIIARIWEADPDLDPLAALNSVIDKKHRSPHQVCRIFGDYAHDSYFLWDFRSTGFEKDVYLRFGQRALTYCFIAEPGRVDTWPEQETDPVSVLNHLACRYFRIESAAEVQEIEAAVKIETAGDGFRCFLSVAARTKRLGEPLELKEVVGESDGKGRTRKAKLPSSAFIDAESIILTIANCGNARLRALEPWE
jgi:hypothetical protein